MGNSGVMPPSTAPFADGSGLAPHPACFQILSGSRFTAMRYEIDRPEKAG
jgi:hypothetical protein